MKGRKLTLILVMLLVVVCTLALAGCHEHTFDEKVWNHDNAGHWHDATCKHTGEKIDYAAHTLFKVDAKEPTCTTEGNNQYYYCGTCNAAFKDEAMTKPTYDYAEVIPVKAHVYNQKVTNASTLVSAATCTSKAVYYFSCECGAIGTETFESGEFASHSLQLIPAVEATCEQAGNNAYYTCTVCNQFFKDEAATKYTSPESEVLPITAHTPVYHAGVPATCTKEGKSEYWTCSVCEKMYEDAYCNSEITSVRTIPTVAHNYIENPADKYKATEATCLVVATYYTSCSECGLQGSDTFSFGGFGAHVLSEIAEKAPTCMAAGNQKYYTCTVCSKFYSDVNATVETTPEEMVIAIVGHAYTAEIPDADKIATPATCVKQATYYKSCIYCGMIDQNVSGVFSHGPLAAHTPGVTHALTLPSCATWTNGNIEYYVCAVENCGKIFYFDTETREIVDKYVTQFVYDELTGELIKTPVPAKIDTNGDNILDDQDAVNPEYGKTLTLDHVTLFAKHQYQEVVDASCLVSMATCKDYAVYYKSCAVCGINSSAENSNFDEAEFGSKTFMTGTRLPHTYEADVNGDPILTPAKVATCTEDGNVAYYFCTVCNNYVDESGKILGESIDSTIVSASGAHEFKLRVADKYIYKPATCYSYAMYCFTCIYCDAINNPDDISYDPQYAPQEVGSLLPHDFDKDEQGNPILTPAVAATCDENGSIAYYYCKECGKFIDESGVAHDDPIVAKLGHDFTVKSNKYPTDQVATCVQEAAYYYECANCGQSSEKYNGLYYTDGGLAPHVFGDLVAAVPATCENPGTIAHYYCEVCKNYYNENQAIVGMDPADLITQALGHVFTVKNKDVKHLKEGTKTTCVELAQYYYECVRYNECGCNSGYRDKDTTLVYTPDEFAPHAFGDLITAVPATCETSGTIAHYICSVCLQYFNENQAYVGTKLSDVEVPALGHVFTVKGAFYPVAGYSDSTCEIYARSYYECVRYKDCGCTSQSGDGAWYDYDKIELKPHSFSALIVGKPADCDATGIYDHYTCATCSNYFNSNYMKIDSIVIPELGHDFTDDTKRDAEHLKASATCDFAETYYYHCSRCDANAKDVDPTKFYEVGEKLPHAVGAWIAAIPADCITDGAKAHYLCSACNKYIDADKTTIIGEKYEDIVIKAIGHDFTAHEVATAFLKDEATCGSKAVYYVSCKNCREIDKTQTFESGELLTTHTGPIKFVPAVDEFSVPSFPATCNYAHYVCECCGAKFADAEGKTPFTQNNGDPYYQLDRPTMAMGTMVGGKFDMNVTTTLTQATSDSYTINGLVPYIHDDNWGVEGLNDGNRVAIQFAAKLLKYASGQTGVIARISSTNGYFKEYTAADLQAGSTANNIEAGSFLAMFNVGKNSTVTLQILMGENTWTNYVFKLATEVTLVEFVEETQPTYWWDGNYDYFQYTVIEQGVANTYRFKDGYCKEEIVDFSAYVIPKLPVEVQLGSVVDGAFVVAGQDSTATLTESLTGLASNYYILDGAILTNANGAAKFAIKLNANFATYFEHNADNEVVLMIGRFSNQSMVELRLPEFKFAEDGTLVWEFDVIAGETYGIALRDYERIDNWLYYYFEIDSDVVTPTKVEAIEASYWTEGRKEHYTLTDAMGIVTYYEDVYCTKQTTKEEVISAQFEIELSTESGMTYALERAQLGSYALKGVVLYNLETENHYFTVRFATKFIEEYTKANYDTTKVIIKIKSGNNEISYTLQDVLNMIESFYVQDETTGEMVLSEAPYILFEGNAALMNAQFTFSFVNPANADDWMTYELSMDQNLYCPILVETVAPTYFTVGTKEHYRCLRTNKMFADETCTTEYLESELVIDKLMPEVEAGSYDFEKNEFTVGGVYYVVKLNSNKVYVVNGTVIKSTPRPGTTDEYKFVLRFNDNFAKLYEDLDDNEIVLKVKLAPNATENHNDPDYAGYNIFTKASAFEADGSIVFISDSFRTDLIEICLWNTKSNDWEVYNVQLENIAHVEFLADPQVGTILADGSFLNDRRQVKNLNYDANNAESGPEYFVEDLQYNVSINELGIYVISGIVPSLQDDMNQDTKQYQFNIRFNADYASLFATAEPNTVILKYVAPDGTVYASYTKAQLFAKDISIYFTGDALTEGIMKCQIMTPDGTNVWMEYQIMVADDTVCPYFEHERAADYWNDGYGKHYVNVRTGKFYSDYACTDINELDWEEDLRTDKLIYDQMEAGVYVVDSTSANGYRFGTHDQIEYTIDVTDNTGIVSGNIGCYNDKSNDAFKGINAFVVKIKGSFYQYYHSLTQNRTGTCVVAILTATDDEGTVIETLSFTRDQMNDPTNIVKFDTDGTILVTYKAIPGATINIALLDPMASLTGNNPADFTLSYNIAVADDVHWTHNAKYNIIRPATYWTEGLREAVCMDCGVATNLTKEEATIAKLIPTVQGDGCTVAYNSSSAKYEVSADLATSTTIKIKVVGTFLSFYANFADGDTVATVKDSSGNVIKTITKADLLADGFEIELTNVTAGMTFTVELVNPDDANAPAEYAFVVKQNA